MHIKTILIAILLSIITLHSSYNSILQLDTKGHTALINDVIITKSGDIITCSNDKTIRVWDKNGRENRKILGEIGDGNGEIFTIALSPNEKFLAVGGYFGNSMKSLGNIRIYNYKSGKLLKLLKSHTNVVYDLSFSIDGKYLISGSSDYTAKIWEVKNNFSLKDTIKSHSNDVYAVKIIKKNTKYFALTAGYDNKISIYSIYKQKTIKEKKFRYKLRDLATIAKEIALCGKDKKIIIMDYNLNIKSTINSETKPSKLAYSPNSKYLIVGTGSYPFEVNIYNTKDYSLINSFKKHTNITMAIGFLDNHIAISGGGDKNEIYLWDIQTRKVIEKIIGVGSKILAVGVFGDEIAWGNENNSSGKNCSKLQKSINLKTFQIDQTKNKQFKRISTTYNKYSLIHSKGGDYGYNDAVLIIKKENIEMARIVRGSNNGLGHNCYGWYKDYIISGGSNGFIKIYNTKGREIASLIGHTGEVYSIALDGDRLVSGSNDQTIRIWDLSHIKEKMKPQLTIFVSKDNQWVVWSNSGYYNASVGGAKYVGFHINQGSKKEGYYVSSDKYKSLYRADIIDYIINNNSEKEAIRLANRNKKVQKIDVVATMPPILYLLSPPNIKTTQKSVTIRFRTKSKLPITKYIITRNGNDISKKVLTKQKEDRVVIDLVDGENIIYIKAKNRFSFSDELLINIDKNSFSK